MTSPQSTEEPTARSGSAGSTEPGTSAGTAPVAASVPVASSQAPGAIEERALKLLRAAVSVEHAAIWAYGLISAYSAKDADLIRTNRNGHIFRRDAANDRIAAAGGEPVQPRAAYNLPVDVVDVESARQLARIAESDCAKAWRAVVGGTDSPDLRTFALSGLSDSAVRLAMLRKLSKLTPFTTPFPGKTG
ncbi:DUF4439 domain-containing protein [Nakamurella silvestris]|nr:DUF4439 domain-containing protein [Nakamurella silvestris]